MDSAWSGNSARWLAATSDNDTRIVDIDRSTTRDSCSLVAGEVPVVRDTTVIDEPLSAGEVLPLAVETDQLDHEVVRFAAYNHGTSLFFRRRENMRQRLHLSARGGP